ncbi:MAG: VWA domain-containing protein, partial [Thermoleophilia bacterium]|nr:VWA domain-containing protein [Thermoleophilia bacterium]
MPVAMDEWLGLQEALRRDLARSSLAQFYLVARAVLVKSERHYDAYDVAFERYFSDIDPAGDAIGDQVWDWLSERPESLRLTPEQKARLDALLERLDVEEIRRRLQERLRNQDGAHQGGNRHIGTGGTSAFGHSGHHPGGFRIGGQSGNRTAAQVAGERRWRDYRSDETLGVRDFSLALRRLRRLSSRFEGPATELDVDATIDATADAGARLELTFRRPRKNAVRVLVLLDVGGSMDDHVSVCSRLFS